MSQESYINDTLWNILFAGLIVLWLAMVGVLYGAYQNAISTALTSAVATFVTATATLILVGVTYSYARQTRLLVVESRKDRRRESITHMLGRGLEPLCNRLRNHRDHIEQEMSSNDQSCPRITSYFENEEVLLEDIPSHVLQTMEQEIPEFRQQEISEYCDRWTKYRERRTVIKDTVANGLADLERNKISDDIYQRVSDDLDSALENQKVSRWWGNKVDSEQTAEYYADNPFEIIIDHNEFIAHKLLTLPDSQAADESLVSLEPKGEKAIGRSVTARFEFERFVGLLRDDLLSYREQAAGTEELLTLFKTDMETLRQLLDVCQTAQCELKDYYGINPIQIQRKVDELGVIENSGGTNEKE